MGDATMTHHHVIDARECSKRVQGLGLDSSITDESPDRLYFTCTLLGATYLLLFCAAAAALSRVLRAAVRDARESPRRRLLAIDDEFISRRRRGFFGIVSAAVRPWTTQKALLAMIILSSLVRIAWAVTTSRTWDAGGGVIRLRASQAQRGVFYTLDVLEAACVVSLITIVARFWAELAYAARQGTGTDRPLGGGDVYRQRGRPPVVWMVARPLQVTACIAAFLLAGIGSILQSSLWKTHKTYLDMWFAYTEAAFFVFAAVTLVLAARSAIAELSLVPIELPTRRRRVSHVAAVTGACALCMIVRAGVLAWAPMRAFPVNRNLEVLGILLYFGVLETLPLTVVLLYNRRAPTHQPSARRSPSGEVTRRTLPEEEPLIGGRTFDTEAQSAEIAKAVVHR